MFYKKCVLIVEDNQPVRENTIEILELSGYEVLAAEDGRQARKHLETRIPDLILCDIQMPEMNGYEFFSFAKNIEKISSVPFIFLSAYSEKKDVEKAMAMGGTDYIIKPFDADELIEIMKKYLLEPVEEK